jgi:hypothetical protein
MKRWLIQRTPTSKLDGKIIDITYTLSLIDKNGNVTVTYHGMGLEKLIAYITLMHDEHIGEKII